MERYMLRTAPWSPYDPGTEDVTRGIIGGLRTPVSPTVDALQDPGTLKFLCWNRDTQAFDQIDAPGADGSLFMKNGLLWTTVASGGTVVSFFSLRYPL